MPKVMTIAGNLPSGISANAMLCIHLRWGDTKFKNLLKHVFA